MKYTKITENANYDFYVYKVNNRDWYAMAMIKGTMERATMAGFSTKKVATQACYSWAEWMKA